MENSAPQMNLSRRSMLFKILRLVTNRLIRGQYRYSSVPEISAEELHQRMQSDLPPVVIDTRSAQEFNGGYGHIPGSQLVPLMGLVMSFPSTDEFKQSVKQLEAQLDGVLPSVDREVVTICPGGGFSLVAAEILAEAGFQDVKSLSGGADGWFKKGYPTTLE